MGRSATADDVNDRGQALIEFALVLPFLVAFVLAIALLTEVGIARLAIEHAAAEGARAGALTNDDAEIRRVALSAVAPLDADTVSIRIEPAELEAPRDRDPRGSLLTVVVEHRVAAPLGLAVLPSIALRGRATRVVEWTP